MSDNLVFLYNNVDKTPTEAKKTIMHILKDFKAIRPCDVEQLWNAALASFKVSKIAGMTTIITIEVDREFTRSSNKPIVLGSHIMVRTYTYTPNNRSCSGIGRVLFNESYDTPADAVEKYRELNNLLIDEA